MESVRHHEPIPPVLLSEDDDGTVQVEDGHHRVTAYWLAGRERLEPYEYILIPRERRRPRFGGVADLLARVGLVLDAPHDRERLPVARLRPHVEWSEGLFRRDAERCSIAA